MENTKHNTYISNHGITASECDRNGRLGISETFRLFQDMAGVHAAMLGISQGMIGPKGLFWIAAKTRIKFYSKPSLEEVVKIKTWPTSIGTFKSDRCYQIINPTSEQIMIEGRTQWAIINKNDGRVVRSASVFPTDVVWNEESTSFSDFPRFSLDGVETHRIGTVKVGSMDIDMGNHMNNTNYVRNLLNCFSCDQIDRLSICDATFIYKASAHEGDVLDVVAGPVVSDEQGRFCMDMAMLFEDKTTSVLARLVLENRPEEA